MTPVDLKILILTEARARIKDGRSGYICTAVDQAVDKLKVKYLHAQECGGQIKIYLQQKLGVHQMYTQWLRKRNATFRQLSFEDQRKAARRGRMAWLKYMIQQLQREE